MRRPRFSLKMMLWIIAVVGILLGAWQAIRPPYRIVWNDSKREYLWRNGLAITFSQDDIKIEMGVDVERWKASRLSQLRRGHGTTASP